MTDPYKKIKSVSTEEMDAFLEERIKQTLPKKVMIKSTLVMK